MVKVWGASGPRSGVQSLGSLEQRLWRFLYYRFVINQTTKSKLDKLQRLYNKLSKGKENVLREISLAEIPESVYNSNAIENSTLTLEDTEKILLENSIPKKLNAREVYEAKNLAKIMEMLLKKNKSSA
jgi:Fic family protein